MVRSKGAKRMNQRKKKWLKKQDQYPTNYHVPIPVVIPEEICEHCIKPEDEAAADDFDKVGFKIPEAVLRAGKAQQQQLEYSTDFLDVAPKPATSHFRFLDLPAELRNRIYELAFRKAKQPVCIPDYLLRPSEDLKEAKYVVRQCYADVTCLPCQLHNILGTGHSGLSMANKQLHSETALIPYVVNTFSVHNLYYLQIFLRLIGEKGRRCLKSLHFGWKLPEEEARVLKMQTSVEETYELLYECKALVEISVDFDIDNMARWRGNGNPRSVPAQYIDEIPHIALAYRLRGLEAIKIGWRHYEGLTGMEEWAKWLIELWRSPEGTELANEVTLETELKSSQDGYWRRFVHWQEEGGSIEESEE